MWFWQRKEIYAGYSSEEFNRIRNLMSDHRIRYDYRMKNRMQMDFGRRTSVLGRTGNNPSLDTMYYLYVNKENFDFAESLLNTAPRQE